MTDSLASQDSLQPAAGQDQSRLAEALNAAATSLHRATNSQNAVLQSVDTLLGELSLHGFLILLEQDQQSFVFHNTPHLLNGPKSTKALAAALLATEIFQQVLHTGNCIYIANSKEEINLGAGQIDKALAQKFQKKLHKHPLILGPLQLETNTIGLMGFSGTELDRNDIPAIRHFCDHIAIALEKARQVDSLNAAHANYQEILDSSADAILLETMQGQIADCNSVACAMYGYSKAELLDLNAADLVVDESDLLLPHRRKQLAQKDAILDTYHKKKDETVFPVEVKVHLIDSQGHGLVAVHVRDISETKSAEDIYLDIKNVLKRRSEELATLRAISLDITATQDLNTLLEIIVQRATNLLDGTGGGFYLCDPQKQEVRCIVSYQTQSDYTGTILQYNEGVAGIVAQQGQPLIIDDYRSWPGRSRVYEEDAPFRAVVGVPVTWQGKVTGILHVLDDSEQRQFTTSDMELLTLFASQAATVIENANLLKNERQRRQEAETLRQAAAALTTTLNLGEVLENILTQLQKMVPYDSATIFLIDEEFFYGKAARGLPNPDIVIGKKFTMDAPLARDIQNTKKVLILEDAKSNPDFQQWGGTDYIRGWIGIPLVVQDQAIGYMTCDSRQVGAYSYADASMAQAFANQAAIAIENARLFEAERSQLLLSQTLQQVGALLTSQLGLNEVLDNLLDLLGRVVQYDSAAIHLINSDGDLEFAAGRGFKDFERTSEIVDELSEHMKEEKLHEEGVIIIPDTRDSDQWITIPGTEYIRAWIGAPLLVKGKPIGNLNVDNKTAYAYNKATGNTVISFANQAAIAIENARLLESERRRRQEAETLRLATAALTSTLDLQKVLDTILMQLEEVVPYDSATIFLLEGNELFGKAARGLPQPETVIGKTFSADNPLLSQIHKSTNWLILEDAQQHPSFKRWGQTAYVRAWMGLPLIFQGRVTGFLTCDNRQVGAYRSGDASLAQAFVNQATIAIENARLFEAERSQLLLSQTMQEVGALLTSQLGLDEVLENILDLLGRVVNYDSATITLLDAQNKMNLVAGRGFEDLETIRRVMYEASQELLDARWSTSEALIIPDTASDSQWIKLPSGEKIRSWIGVPLTVKGQIIGHLHIDSYTPNTYDAPTSETVMAFANQAAIAIENARLFEAERNRISSLEAIRQATLSVTASLELHQVLHAILSSALELFPEAYNSHIFLYDSEGEGKLTFGNALFRDGTQGKPWSDPRQDGLTYSVARSGEMIVVPDMTKHPIYDNTPSSWTGAIVGLPLKIGPRVAGVMNVSFNHARDFLESELRLLQLLSDQAAIAIENARLFEQAATERRHLSLLYDINQQIAGSQDPTEILNNVVKLTRQAFGGSIGEAFLYQPKENRLSLRALSGITLNPLSQDRAITVRRMDVGLVGWVAKNRKPANVPDVSQDSRWVNISGIDDGIKSALCAPILSSDRLTGVLLILNKQANAFSQEHLDLLQTICQGVGLAITNAKHTENLEQTVTQRTSELTELYILSQEIGYPLSHKDLLRLLLHHLQKAIRSSFVVGCLDPGALDSIVIKYNRPLRAKVISKIEALWLEILGAHDEDYNRISSTSIKDENFSADLEPIKRVASFIQYPIYVENQLIGWLGAGSERDSAFGAEQERLLTTFTNQAASAAQRLSNILSAQQRQLESLVEYLPVGVLLLDADFRILVSNPLGRELLTTLSAINENDKVIHLGSYSLKAITTQHEQIPFEVSLEGPPQRIFALHIRSVATEEDKSLHPWVLTVSEITSERENQIRIQIQERLATVGQLAAGIAHDFNNIMATILVYTDLLLSDLTLSPKTQEKLNIIQGQVERATSLIRQILDFSRRSVMDQSVLDLLPLVKELDKMLVRVLPETIRLDFTYQPGAYWVRGDPSRLQQVFMNLALNARDAMPTGGTLHVELDITELHPADTPPIMSIPPGKWIRIIVSDTGVGIPAKDRRHIFEPFFTTKPVGQGTGLGLAQVYGIVKQHDGYIDVHSLEGQGASFIIYLPFLEVEVESKKLSQTMVHIDGSGQTVLLVEDDEATQDALAVLMEAQGYHVIKASNGVEALKRVEEAQVPLTLVVSDMVMPEMGGIELYQILMRDIPKLRMLLITGHPLDEEQQVLAKGENLNWLQKPFSVQEFNLAISRLIANK